MGDRLQALGMRQTVVCWKWVVASCAVVVFGWVWILARGIARPDVATIRFSDGETIRAEIADSERERRIGLSDRPFLDLGQGMLFVFGEPVHPSFWMKDMRFSIDIVWIADGTIIGVASDVPVPASPPLPGNGTGEAPLPGNGGSGAGWLPTYEPPGPVDMVLELNAGAAARHGLAAGDRLDIGLP